MIPLVISAVSFVVVCGLAAYQFASTRRGPGWVAHTYRATAAEFDRAQTVVPSGVLAVETDTGRTKLGSGVPWADLPYFEAR